MDEAGFLLCEHARFQAMMGAETDRLAALLDDDLVYVHSNGQVDSKTTLLSRIAGGEVAYRRIECGEMRLRLVSPIMLRHGLLRLEAVVAGRPVAVTSRFLTVSRWSGENWRLLAYQPTSAA